MHVEQAPAPRLPVSNGERAVVLALVFGFVGLLGADLASSFSVNKLGAVFLLAFWLPMLAVHALGHALAARLVGWRLVELGIGFGRELVGFRAGTLRVCVRTLPLEGYALVRPGSARNARAKRALIYLAGPLANLAVLGAVAPTLAWSLPAVQDGVAALAARSLAMSAALAALCALVPFRSAGNPSDGLALLECVFASDETLRERLAWPFLSEARRLIAGEQWPRARELLERGLASLPGDERLVGARAVLLAAEGDPPAAYAALEALGAPEDKPAMLRAELISDAAWAVLLGQDEALLGDALRAAGRASELCPDDPHHEILLGRAAFERGQHATAYASLMSAYKRTHDADQEAQCIAYLALVCRALHQADRATPFGDYAARFTAALRGRPVPPGLRERVLGGRGPT